MPASDLVKTGIFGLDGILSGGIPRGNVILLEGAIGCGKTTLGVEFIYRGASQFDEPGIIVLFEVSPDKVIRDAQGFGWDLRELERTDRVRIVFTSRDVLRQELQQADSVLLEEAAKIGARRIFIDGVARLVGGNEKGRQTFLRLWSSVVEHLFLRPDTPQEVCRHPSINSLFFRSRSNNATYSGLS